MSNFSYLCFSRFLWGELQYGKIIRDEMLELFIYDFDFWIFYSEIMVQLKKNLLDMPIELKRLTLKKIQRSQVVSLNIDQYHCNCSS